MDNKFDERPNTGLAHIRLWHMYKGKFAVENIYVYIYYITYNHIISYCLQYDLNLKITLLYPMNIALIVYPFSSFMWNPWHYRVCCVSVKREKK